MFAILYVPTATIIDVFATENATQRFLAETLGSSPSFTVPHMPMEHALAHLRRFDASRHDVHDATAA